MDEQILTVSGNGEIALPESLRKRLGINSGDKLAVFEFGDTIMLKTMSIPSVKEFEAELEKAQAWAREVGYKEEDVADIIKDVRNRKNR